MDRNTALLAFIFLGGYAAQELSRAYQRRKTGFVDEIAARRWRYRVIPGAIAWLLILAILNLWVTSRDKSCSPQRSEDWSVCSQ
jgi:hypothetical protein